MIVNVKELESTKGVETLFVTADVKFYSEKQGVWIKKQVTSCMSASNDIYEVVAFISAKAGLISSRKYSKTTTPLILGVYVDFL